MKRLTATLVLGLTAGTAGDGRAQIVPEPWSVFLVAEGGVIAPVRHLGKNRSDNPEEFNLQVDSHLQASPVVAGGIEIVLPPAGLRARALFGTTVGATSKGNIGAAAVVGEDVLPPREVDATMRYGLAELLIHPEAPTRNTNVVFSIGAGLRSYSFDDLECPGADPDRPYLRQSCLLIGEIWEDSDGVAPMLRFGLSLATALGPLSAFLNVHDLVGPYGGGGGTSEGAMQNDVMGTAGLSIRVR